MNWRSLIVLATIAAFSSYLYDVGRVLKIMVVNRPSNLEKITNLSLQDIRFADHMRNCEDVVLDTQGGFALFSCSPGRDKWNTVMGVFIDASEHGSVYLYPYAKNSSEPPARLNLDGFSRPFHPLGLSYHPESKTIAIANHGGDQATVELFDFDPAARSMTFRHSVVNGAKLPAPNSIAFVNATHAFVSNTHRSRIKGRPTTLLGKMQLQLSHIELKSGAPIGSVSLVNLETGSATKVIDLGFANGVDLLHGGQTLAVASSIKAAVYLYNITDTPSRPTYIRRLKMPFIPDNLSIDDQDHLYVAGHPDAAALTAVAQNNWLCRGEESQGTHCPRAPSWVAEWDPAQKTSTELKNLYVDDIYGSSSGVVYDVQRNVLIVVGLYEKGILVGRK